MSEKLQPKQDEELIEVDAEVDGTKSPHVTDEFADIPVIKLTGRKAKLSRTDVKGIEEKGLVALWAYDGGKFSDIPNYRGIGYWIFEIPAGKTVRDFTDYGVADGSSIRLEDCILMVTTKAQYEEIQRAGAEGMSELSTQLKEFGKLKMQEGLSTIEPEKAPAIFKHEFDEVRSVVPEAELGAANPAAGADG